MPCRSTHISIVGIRHLSGAVDYTTHDPYLQMFEMRCCRLDVAKCRLEVKQGAPTARTCYVFGLGKTQTGRLEYRQCKIVALLRCQAIGRDADGITLASQ